MEKVLYRPARLEDIPGAVEIHRIARNEMLNRNNLGIPRHDVEEQEAGFTHVLNTGVFRVAEMDGRLAAVCHAVVRDGIWFLSSYWVLPELQRLGVGGPLLRSVWAEGQRQEARVFCVWASVDPTAMANYMKLGMLPGTQLLKFGGEAAKLRLPEPPMGYEVRALDPAAGAAIDRVVRATPRLMDHEYWATRPALHGSLVLRNGKPCGYYYASDGGDVAPAAWLDPSDGDAVLSLACREAVERGGSASLRFAGYNHQAARFALGAGFTFTGFSHFLTTDRFGKIEQYVASGPLLF
ncbi:MAG: GNAT family N-acetyltransferase [Bacillota bacterium]